MPVGTGQSVRTLWSGTDSHSSTLRNLKLTQFQTCSISEKVKSGIRTILKPTRDLSFREWRRHHMTVVAEYCWATARMSPLVLPPGLSCCFECLLKILTGKRLSDKHNGRSAVRERNTFELYFRIKTLKPFEYGQTPTSLRRDFDLRTSAVKTILENREHL